MQPALDNPVWHALVGPHAALAVGQGLARHYPRDIAPFSAIAEATDAAYADLAADLPAGLEARLFRPSDEPAPAGWETVSARPIVQMVADAVPHAALRDDLTVLGTDDTNEMVELAGIAKPGPFGPRTPWLGRYVGYRAAGRLLAMGGERFRLPGAVELSGISVHPDARGAGLGSAITSYLARSALARGETPFLHVSPDNPAVALYRRLGFRERTRSWVIWRRPPGGDATMNITGFPSIFFGWKVVAVAFTVAAFAYGVGFYGPSVFVATLHQGRGWSVSVISAAITAHFLLSAMMVVHLADAHHRFGIARVTRAGILASAIGILGWSLATAPWHLFAASVLTGAGWAATSGAAINTMVSPWFNRRRATALSHAFNGASVGGVLFTPLWVALIASIGFVGAASLIGVVMLAVLWPLAGRYLAATPASLGVAPDGDAAPPAASPTNRPGQPQASFAALLRNRRFTTLSVAFALGLFAQIGVVAHLVTRLAPVFGAGNAAAAVSLATACAVIGRLLLGALLGGADRRLVAMSNFAMQACGVVCLALGMNGVVLLLGCVLLGLGIGNLVSLPPLIAQGEFAQADVPRVVALVTAVNQAVFAFAPAVFGLLAQVSDGYAVPFMVAAAIQVVAAFVVILGRPCSSCALVLKALP
jgi:ribosomal protein S18 acetylase RimI-like enzyme/MFS family permease